MKNKTMWYLILFIVLMEFSSSNNRIAGFLHAPLEAILSLLAILLALVVHEFAHAWMADRLGDPNPRLAGRVSLNPLVHLDPVGTLLIVLTGFGWGKPVQFDPYNLADPDKDGAVIAAAGPVSNLILAVITAIAMHIVPMSYLAGPIGLFFYLSFLYNVNLAVFNLIPVFPLDGHHVLRAFMSKDLRCRYDLFNRSVGILLAILIMLPLYGGQSLASLITTPAIQFAYNLLFSL